MFGQDSNWTLFDAIIQTGHFLNAVASSQTGQFLTVASIRAGQFLTVAIIQTGHLLSLVH